MILEKLSLLLICIFLLASCTNSKVTEEGKYFKTITSKYFKGYDAYEEVSIDKIENKYSIVQINKSELSLNEFLLIDKNLTKDGWKKISERENFYEYCFGEKIYLGALYPEKEKYRNLAGNEIVPFNQNQWLMILSYKEGKVNYCRKDKLPILELE